jgi:hypothetical protein
MFFLQLIAYPFQEDTSSIVGVTGGYREKLKIPNAWFAGK